MITPLPSKVIRRAEIRDFQAQEVIDIQTTFMLDLESYFESDVYKADFNPREYAVHMQFDLFPVTEIDANKIAEIFVQTLKLFTHIFKDVSAPQVIHENHPETDEPMVRINLVAVRPQPQPSNKKD